MILHTASSVLIQFFFEKFFRFFRALMRIGPYGESGPTAGLRKFIENFLILLGPLYMGSAAHKRCFYSFKDFLYYGRFFRLSEFCFYF